MSKVLWTVGRRGESRSKQNGAKLVAAITPVIEGLENRKLFAFQAGINFAPYASEAEGGYLTDSGEVYGVRQSGLTYGWNASMTSHTFARTTSLSQKWANGINTAGTGNTWEIAVPNGTYYVRMVAGDASVTSGTYKYNLEGTTNFLNGSAGTGTAAWVTATGTVTVSDGKLTVTNGSGASAYNLDFIDITDLSAKNSTTVNQPTNLAARARNNSTVDLTWVDNSDNEDFDTGYLIERKTGSGSFAQIDATSGGTRELYTTTSVTAGTTYTYRIRAQRTNTSGAVVNSAYSNEFTLTVPSGTTQAPYLGSAYAVPAQIEAEDYDYGANGDAYSDTTAANAGGFYRSGSVDIGVFAPPNTNLSPVSNNYYVGWVDTNDWQEYTVNVANAGNYYVDANVSSAGQGGVWKVQVGGVDKATGIQVADTGGFTQYGIQSSGAFSLSSGNGQIFRFQATAKDATGTFVGNFDYFKIQRFDAPASVTATAVSSSQIALTWASLASNGTGFVIERKTGSGGTYSAVATVGPAVTSWQDTGLTTGQQYYYRIRATRNLNGTTAYTAYSTEVNATPAASGVAPAAASTLTAVASAGQIALAWSDNSSNETGFKIQRKQGAGAWTTLVTTSANVVTYFDTSVTAGQTYSYQVIATNASGDASASNSATATAPTTVSLTPTDDAYGQSGTYGDNNFGGAAELDIKNGAVGYDRQGYLKFDLSGITSVSSVQLQLYGKRNTSGDGDITFNVSSVADTSWTEGGLTYNSRPAMGSVLGSFISIAPNTSYALYQVDVTSYVQAQLAAGHTTISLGVAGTATAPAAYLIIPSKDSSTNKPQLLVGLTANASPTIATAPGASPSTVTGTSTNLSVLGADDGGEGNLTYSWSATSPSGATAPTFSGTQGTNGMKNTTATFTSAGTYTFTASINDGTNSTLTSPITVVVNQTLTSTVVTPSTSTVGAGGTQQFAASGKDQFGQTMIAQPTFTWSVPAGGGTVSSAGLYTAALTSGSATIRAASGAINGNAGVTISNAAPTIVTAANATPNPVTGTTVNLSVLGADDGGEGHLTYTWTVTPPAGATAPTFSGTQGTNGIKNTTATFSKSGTYTFAATANDGVSSTAPSTVSVVVNQTLTSIVVTPATSAVSAGGTQQFAASAKDQFGQALTAQPTFTWSVPTGSGTVSSSGLYTAALTSGSATVRAASGAVNGSAGVTISNAAPTIATAASATPSPVTGTTVNLSVLGADDGGESHLTYTWTVTPPAGATAPTFSGTPGTNGMKNTVATFSKAGTYTFAATANDGVSSTSPSTVTVVVNQTLTAITVTPSTSTIGVNGTQQFAASGSDQFGQTMIAQPTFAWTVPTGAGTISSSGLYTASATSGTSTVRAANGAINATASVSISNSAPTIATAPASSPSTVTGTTANLSILGADDGGEGNLTYRWSATPPSGAAAPAFSGTQGTNGMKNTTATFTSAGTYTFVATIDDGTTSTSSSPITVVINQTLTSVAVTPSTSTVGAAGTQQFAASGKDQFGQTMIAQPTFTWSVPAGGGAVSSSGLYTAALTSGSATVRAASGAINGSAGVTISNAAPTIATAASATPSPVTGTTVNLSVLGADDGGESHLTYMWSVTSPSGATAPIFSGSQGTNGMKNTVATFSKAGTYTFAATASDGTFSSSPSTVTVVVSAVPTAIAISPTNASIVANATQDFDATVNDQFGNEMTGETVNWDVISGQGSFTGNTYLATNVTGDSTIRATDGAANATTTLTVVSAGSATLTATAISSSEIRLSWTNPDGAHLELEAKDPGDPTLNYNVVDANFGASSTSGSTIIDGLMADTEYSFKLRSDIGGLSRYTTASKRTGPVFANSDAGATLDTPDQVSVISNGIPDSFVTLHIHFRENWNPDSDELLGMKVLIHRTDDPYNVLITSRDVFSRPLPGDQDPLGSSEGPNQWYFTGFILPPGQTYSIALQAVRATEDGEGIAEYSQLSDPVTFTTSGDVFPPPEISAGLPQSDGTIPVTWTPANTGYIRFVGVKDGRIVYGENGSLLDEASGLADLPAGVPGTKYFAIRSDFYTGDLGEDGYSNLVDGDGSLAPATPKNFDIVPVNRHGLGPINALWDNTSDDETQFILERSSCIDFPDEDGNDPDGPTQTFTLNADTTSTTDVIKDQLWGQTYYYRVKAVNEAGESDWSLVKSDTNGEINCVTCQGAVSAAGTAQSPSATMNSLNGGGSAGVQNNTAGIGDTQPKLYELNCSINDITAYYGPGIQTFFHLNTTTNQYVEDFGGTDTLIHAGGKFTLSDSSGNRYTFGDNFAASSNGGVSEVTGQFDAAGNNWHVISRNTAGQPTEARLTNASGVDTESWLYSYFDNGDNTGKLWKIVQRTKDGIGWKTIHTQTYSYYDSTTSGGISGEVIAVQIADEDGAATSNDYYRYYTDDNSGGFTGAVKFALGEASYQRLMDAHPGILFDALTDAQIAPYADTFYGYNDAHQVTTRTVQGEGCSACSGGEGTYTYSYSTSNNFPTGDDKPLPNAWTNKTIETQPDGNQNITYYNGNGQVMLSVYHDVTTGQMSGTFHVYDADGREILTAAPSSVTLPTDLSTIEQHADLLNKVGGNYQYLRDGAGKITLTDYYASTTAGAMTAGGVSGYEQDVKVQRGETGTAIIVTSEDYFARSDGTTTIYPVAHSTQYRNSDGTGAETTAFAYTWFTGSLQQQSETVSLPVVSSAENGSALTDAETTVFNELGQAIWTKDADGFITYTEYDPITGAVTKSIQDVNTSATTTFDTSTLPSGWTTPASGGLNLVTAYEFDELGRTTKVTNPDGNITFMVYKDGLDVATGFENEVRTYSGWHYDALLGGYTSTGPVMVSRDNRPGSYSETLTYAAPVIASATPDGTDTISNLQSLSRTLTSTGGQVVESDEYFNLSGLTYSASAFHLGTAGTNYYATTYGYDHNGNPNKVISPTGTITRTEYDGQSRAISTWVGTDDTPTTGYWSTDNLAGTNMVETSSMVYDNGGVGDGNVTQMTQYPHDGSANRVTSMAYDWRDRLVVTKSAVQTSESTSDNTHFIQFTDYDNLDEAIAVSTYDGDGVTVDDSDSDGVPDKPSSSLLRAYTTTSYDEQGRAYRTSTYSADPSNGSTSAGAIQSNTWYDHRGEVIKTQSSGGPATKVAYDGAGRTIATYTTDGGGDSTWTDAGNVTGDIVLQQDETTYDGDGNAILMTDRQRFRDATATGALGNPSSTGTTAKARVSYDAMYSDAAGRTVANVDVGTNGGSAYTRPSSIPARSDNVLVTSYNYDAAGRLFSTVDPRGLESRTYYDAAGRTTKTIADYVDGTPSAADDQTTTYAYDGANHVISLAAVMPSGTASQTTQYLYGVSPATGSDLTSNDILRAVRYPDPTTGSASSSQQESYTANALGQTLTKTDRDGNVHTYSYDVLGRQTSDAVTTLGSGVDGAVRRIDTAYNTQGQVYLFTSYADTAAATVVNQVMRTYNGFGQVIAEYQAVSGAVDIATTPKVQYAYDTANNGSRLISMTYPNGRVLTYHYGSSGLLDDTIGRLTSISDGTTTLENYAYLGLTTVVSRGHPENGVTLTYVGTGTGDGGDQYTGIDRFGRVIDQKWVNASGTVIDDYTYTYDRDGNVLSKANGTNSALSETYTYDGLNRLTATRRNGSAYQSWDLDQLGNMASVTTGGTAQSRTSNSQNQLATVGASTLAYDQNGNTTTDEEGRTLLYDAWNRLVEAKSGGSSLIRYGFDALDRQVKEGTAIVYFDTQWQRLEDRSASGQTTASYAWSPAYLNAMIARDRDTDGNSTLDERLYATQDANFNVTSVTSATGMVLERMGYDAYGDRQVFSSSWSNSTDNKAWQQGFQGGFYDVTLANHMLFEQRVYNVDTMRWEQQDPGVYINGLNTYGFVTDSPILNLDPSGLEEINLVHATRPGDAVGVVKEGLSAGKDGLRWFATSDAAGTGASSEATVQLKFKLDLNNVKDIPDCVLKEAEKGANIALKGQKLGDARPAAWARAKWDKVAEWINKQEGDVWRSPEPGGRGGFHYAVKESAWKISNATLLGAEGSGSQSAAAALNASAESAEGLATSASRFGPGLKMAGRLGGRALVVVGVGVSAWEIYSATDHVRETVIQVGGLAGMAAGGWAGAELGGAGGGLVGSFGAGVGAAPGATIGAIGGGIIGGIGGAIFGKNVTRAVYDWAFSAGAKDPSVQ